MLNCPSVQIVSSTVAVVNCFKFIFFASEMRFFFCFQLFLYFLQSHARPLYIVYGRHRVRSNLSFIVYTRVYK